MPGIKCILTDSLCRQYPGWKATSTLWLHAKWKPELLEDHLPVQHLISAHSFALTKLNFCMTFSFNREFTDIKLKHSVLHSPPIPVFPRGLQAVQEAGLYPTTWTSLLCSFMTRNVLYLVFFFFFYIIHGSQSQAWTYDSLKILTGSEDCSVLLILTQRKNILPSEHFCHLLNIFSKQECWELYFRMGLVLAPILYREYRETTCIILFISLYITLLQNLIQLKETQHIVCTWSSSLHKL